MLPARPMLRVATAGGGGWWYRTYAALQSAGAAYDVSLGYGDVWAKSFSPRVVLWGCILCLLGGGELYTILLILLIVLILCF